MLIRLLGVRFSHLVRGVQQLDLFEDTPEMVKLYLAMDKLRGRYGRKAIRRAVGVPTRKEIAARAEKETGAAVEEEIRNEMEAKVKGNRYGMVG